MVTACADQSAELVHSSMYRARMADDEFAMLTREHLRRAPEQTLYEVTDRLRGWLVAVRKAGLAGEFDRAFDSAPSFEEIAELIEPALRSAAAPTAPTADFAATLLSVEEQLGAPLPPSLVDVWELRARSPRWRALVDAFLGPEMLDPTAYLNLPEWWRGHGHRLAVSWSPDRRSISPVHESLEDDYLDWFANEDESGRATGSTWRRLVVGDGAMLDPGIADSLIEVAGGAGEWVEVVSDWRDERGESPIFRAGDDFEGYAYLLGSHVPEWLGLEIDVAVAAVVDGRPDSSTSDGQ